ncbi:MAG: dTDP-4-dehydrorhamnose 3,5-epimerase [Pseudonocardia sp.]|nr:dTDP-4-dehydrorhamnose 3,5-epimerase [Pseudonocardia sp.]
MQVQTTEIEGVLLFVPQPHPDERGFFSRTFDVAAARTAGVDGTAFVQDSQSRSARGVIRGMHGRIGLGESKLVRCAHGALHDVIVDARPGSPTFGRVASFRLDDENMTSLYIPAGCLHGFQSLTDVADACYRMDREHDPAEDVTVRFDDPDLGIAWPLPAGTMSAKDAAAPSWKDLCARLGV